MTPEGGSFRSSLRNPVPSLKHGDSSASLSAMAERERARSEFGVVGLGPSGLGGGELEAGMLSGSASSEFLVSLSRLFGEGRVLVLC